jgi:hypothetical protein
MYSNNTIYRYYSRFFVWGSIRTNSGVEQTIARHYRKAGPGNRLFKSMDGRPA